LILPIRLVPISAIIRGASLSCPRPITGRAPQRLA
jgi:hypothetical protein